MPLEISLSCSGCRKIYERDCGTDREFTTDEITGQLRTLIVTKLTNAIADSKLKIEEYASNLEQFSAFATEKLSSDFDTFGLKVTSILVENISMPEEVKKKYSSSLVWIKLTCKN